MKFNWLRKTITVLFTAGFTALSIIGCGSDSTERSTDTTKETIGSEETAEEDAGDDETVVIRLGDQVPNLVSYFTYAKETGILDEYFANYNVEFELTDFASGPAANEAIAANQLDATIMGNVPAITGPLSGYGEKIVAVVGYSDSWVSIVTPAGSDVESIADLKGKQVGSFLGTSFHYYLGQYLEDGGLTIDDVEIVNTASESATAIRNGEVSAAILNTGVAYSLVEEGSARILSDKLSVKSPSLLMLASDSFTEKYPEYTSILIQAVDATLAKIDEDRDAFWAFYEDYMDGDITDIKNTWDFHERKVTKVDEAARNDLDQLLQWLGANDLADISEATVDDIYDNTFAEKAGY